MIQLRETNLRTIMITRLSKVVNILIGGSEFESISARLYRTNNKFNNAILQIRESL